MKYKKKVYGIAHHRHEAAMVENIMKTFKINYAELARYLFRNHMTLNEINQHAIDYKHEVYSEIIDVAWLAERNLIFYTQK